MTISRNPASPPSGPPSYTPDTLPVYLGGDAGGGVVTLIYDAFTDTPSTALISHTPDTVGPGVSSNWTLWGSGTWTIATDGSGAATTNSSYNGAYVDVTKAQHVCRGNGINSTYGLITRFIDSSNHFLVYFSVNTVYIYENGVTLRSQTPSTFGSGPEIRVTTTTADITVWAQAGSTTEEISYSSTLHNTATKVGLAQSGVSSADIDDFICIDSTDTGDLP